MTVTTSQFTAAKIDNQNADTIRLIDIDIGSLSLRLCQRPFGDPGSAYLFSGEIYEPLVTAVGEINHGYIDPITWQSSPSSVQVSVFNNVPMGGADCFSKLYNSYDMHYASISIADLPNGGTLEEDKIYRFRGQIEDLIDLSEEHVTISCSGYEQSIANKFSYEIVTEDVYPNANPDDIGKMLPQVYGIAYRVPFRGVDVGGNTSLVGEINDSQTDNIYVSNGSAIGETGVLLAGKERIFFGGRDKLTGLLSSVTRGMGGSTSVTHVSGARLIQETDDDKYYYIIGHAVQSIDNVYVNDVRQSGNYTSYTGQTGDEHASYPGKACIEFTSLPIISRETSQSNTDTIAVSTRYSVTTNAIDSPTVTFPKTFNVPAGSYNSSVEINDDADNYWSPSLDWESSQNGYKVSYLYTVEVISYGTAGLFRISATNFENATFHELFEITNGSITTPLQIPGILYIAHADADAPEYNADFKVYATAAWDGEVNVVLSGVEITLHEYQQDATKTGTVTLGGNEVAETVVNGIVTADVHGFEDTDGTYTGTPNTLISQPNHVRKHILVDRCGQSSDRINATNNTEVETFYSNNGYNVCPVLLDPPNTNTLLHDIAFQSKSISLWDAGEHFLIPINTIETTDKTIDHYSRINTDMLSNSFHFTNRVNIKNNITALYLKYWSLYSNDESNTEYRASVWTSGETSVGKYGVLRQEHSFPYITGEVQATAVVDWQLDENKQPRLLSSVPGGQFLSNLTKGDVLDFYYTSDDYLDKALLGLVTASGEVNVTQFRVINITDYNETIKLDIVQIP